MVSSAQELRSKSHYGCVKASRCSLSSQVANETQITEGLLGMRITRLNAIACVMTFLFSVAFTPARAQTNVSSAEARAIAENVYIYGYPLVTLEMTRRVTTNTEAPVGLRAPMGQFAHAREFPPVTYRDIPGANADTLYSPAWLDLAKEPYILKIPDAEGRYFMMPMLDGWSDVFQAPGTRTTGTKAQTYAITGPNWKGKLPTGVTQYKSATWSGSSDVPIPPARRRITRRCIPFRTRFFWFP